MNSGLPSPCTRGRILSERHKQNFVCTLPSKSTKSRILSLRGQKGISRMLPEKEVSARTKRSSVKRQRSDAWLLKRDVIVTLLTNDTTVSQRNAMQPFKLGSCRHVHGRKRDHFSLFHVLLRTASVLMSGAIMVFSTIIHVLRRWTSS